MTLAEDGGGAPPARCAGPHLRRYFSGGLAALERCAAAVDRLNVFPVPDGDTGTNLAITVRQAVGAAQGRGGDGLGAVARELAAGALRGARGNSGAIYAQLCAGLAESFGDAES